MDSRYNFPWCRALFPLWALAGAACGGDDSASTAGAAGGSGGGASNAASTGPANGAGGNGGLAGASTSGTGGVSSGLDGPILYVTNDDGTLYAFRVGTWTALGQWSGLPITDGVRGIDADPETGVLYVAHGGDNLSSSGHLLAWSLTGNAVLYDGDLQHGIDQFAVGGGKIYMPAGELANTSTWY